MFQLFFPIGRNRNCAGPLPCAGSNDRFPFVPWNKQKIEQAKNLQNSIDITKELITKYFISTQDEYDWLASNFNLRNVDRDWKLEKKTNKMLYYENTIEYKIKHPIYVVLKKLSK